MIFQFGEIIISKNLPGIAFVMRFFPAFGEAGDKVFERSGVTPEMNNLIIIGTL